MIRIIHTADGHHRKDHADEFHASLNAIIEEADRTPVDLFVFAGDLFDGLSHNTESAGLPQLQRGLQRLMDRAPVVAVQGTPTHDLPGCYDFLVETNAEHGWYMLQPGVAYFLADGEIFDESQVPMDRAKLLVLGCPEPSKEWFLADKKGLGRDEADQAVIAGMRELLLGLGGIRGEYPDLPCLMVYHGQVAGASMANGQQVRPGGIQIGRDDLALVGADYYALGDIHLAQKIIDLPAYYPGSMYPVNWGEVDIKSFKVVRFDERALAGIHSVPYGRPPRKKIVIEVAMRIDTGQIDYDTDIDKLDVSGYQVWLHFVGSEAAVGPIDVEGWLVRLELMGAVGGSRVTTEISHTETVRAGEIAEAQRLQDKIRLWAENSGETVTDEILEAADALEAEGREAGVTSEGLHIRLDRLLLRGAIGIWKGQGVDEIDLDLTGYDSGLIGLLGRNGAGKTTLIENLHPFPSLLTRSGTLQSNFRLRDSYRDLYFTNARSGDSYRAFIQIDGANASGSCSYHLYKNGQPLVNGRKADYEEKVRELFGSLALFQRSVFVTQKATKNNPELSDATKGERKAMFRELAGLDYLQFYADTCKAQAKALDESLTADRREIEVLAEYEDALPAKQGDLAHTENNLAQMRIALEHIIEEGRERKAAQAETAKRLQAHEEVERKIADLTEAQYVIERKTRDLETERNGLCDLQAKKTDLEAKLARGRALQKQEEAQREEQTRVLKERERLAAENTAAMDRFRDARRKIEVQHTEAQKALADLGSTRAICLKEIDQLTERLQPVTCPHCGKDFALGGEETEAELKAKQAEVWEIDKQRNDLDGLVATLAAGMDAFEEPLLHTLPEFDPVLWDKIVSELQRLNIEQVEYDLEKASKADARIAEIENRVAELADDLGSNIGEVLRLSEKRDPDAAEEDRVAKVLLEESTHQYTEAKTAIARKEAEADAIKKQIAEIEAKLVKLETLRAAVVRSTHEAQQYRFLERACGPDGVQALELDAMGPGIAEVANRILRAAYGSRFAIEFRTTRIAGKGSKTRQVEDFEIVVHDSETGTEQPFDTLSGGESVWIKRALYDAFGIVRDRQTEQRFLTYLQDEADGALDPEARVAYFRMLEAAHAESCRHQTIVITQSSEVQEMLPQRIRMEDLAREASR